MVAPADSQLPRLSSAAERFLVRLSTRISPNDLPGCEGLSKQEALYIFRELAALGKVQGISQLIQEYPDNERELREIFS